MKKQGAPDPLDEAHFTNLKRKAGMSVAESRAESQQYVKNKKRRTGGKSEEKKAAGKEAKKAAFTNGLPSQRSALKKSKKAAAKFCSSPRRKPASMTRPKKISIPSAWSPRSCSC